MMTHAAQFVAVLGATLARGDVLAKIEELVDELVELRRRRGRLFVLGVGGGAANAAHAVCDLRKLCDIDAYAPTDSAAELTARTNDEGWDTVFVEWLRVSRPSRDDALLVFSVGGGTVEVSACVRAACRWAGARGVRVFGVVGRSEGATAREGDVVVVTGIEGPLLTPVTEAAQVAILHALVSDPRLMVRKTKW